MSLRPEEKRQVLASLLEYQKSFGGGALMGMETGRKREEQEMQRGRDLADERQRSTRDLITRGKWATPEGDPLPFDALAGAIETGELPEGTVPYEKPVTGREFAPVDPALALQREVGAIERIKNSWTGELKRIDDRHGGFALLRSKIQANVNDPRNNPVSEEERQDYRRYIDAEKNIKKLREAMTSLARGDSVQSAGQVLVIAPDGQQGYVPVNQLEAALQQGYKRAQ